ARDGRLRPELREPAVTLAPMSAGRAVAEDYYATGLSLRGHPLDFLRGDLGAQGYRPCRVLDGIRSGRGVALAGLVLMRQKPGSAKGTMFITLEDETGIANLIVWPAVFAQHRRLILTAGMMGVRGRVQRQGIVVHVVAQGLVDLTPLLRRVGEREDGAAFPLPAGRGDEVRGGGGPDRREVETLQPRPRDSLVPDLSPGIRVPTRNFR
ncbi:OB-fold nucleic acid binding domain-containing protein, partial [Methylobacterium trifolii]